MVTLLDHLAAQAATHARRGLSAYLRGDDSEFFLFAGIAVELAMKTKLARENPAFLAPANKFDSAVALTRLSGDMDRLPPGLQTIGGGDALRRLEELDPAFRDHHRSVTEILGYRNGEAHLGTADATTRERTLVGFLRAVRALLRQGEDLFWAEHAEFVRTRLDELAEKEQREVAERISRARAALQQKFGQLSADQKATLLAAAGQHRDRLVDHRDVWPVECPACDGPGVAHGETEFVEWDGDEDGPFPVVQFYAHSVNCFTCGLSLNGQDQLEFAGLDAAWPNDEIDPYELGDPFDEDYYRGR
jgi:hypothetical protein